ncbi:MAG: hypothetical protein EXR49_05945 [Dehalococcoidia bacterium]|nr:hypothetical protein [Dehalococcoidia bacterium]
MLLDFERGDRDAPKGHALAYVRNRDAPDQILGAYLVVPPIAIDLGKYMPPMFAGKLGLPDMGDIAAVPLPPVPEPVPSLEHLRRLAEARDDDLLALGTVDATDVQAMLMLVTEASQSYASVYKEAMQHLAPAAAVAAQALPAAASDTVDDVVYSLMSDRDKIAAMGKLLGKLRYAVESASASLRDETVREMQALAARLPAKYQAPALVEAAALPGDRGRALASLRLDRCYKLCNEDYMAVERLDREIRDLA